jgi:DNA-binding MarR family transcriptional regulator
MAEALPKDTDLEQLLTQLLRMVSPGFSDHGGSRAGVAGSAATGSVAAGSATTEPGPDDGHDATAEQVNGQRPGSQGAAAIEMPGVSASEARALIELVSARGIAQGELAGLLGLDKSTVSRLAAGLERKGWLRRGRDEDNQRYVRLYLTPEGGEVAGRVWQAWQSRQARIMAALSPEERAGLAAGLGGLVRGLAAEGLRSEATGNGS